DADHFSEHVSQDFRALDSDDGIQTTLEVLPIECWPKCSELARLRIENALLKAIDAGRCDPVSKEVQVGRLGTYITGIQQHLLSKHALISVVTSKLARQQPSEDTYVIEHLLRRLPTIDPTPSD